MKNQRVEVFGLGNFGCKVIKYFTETEKSNIEKFPMFFHPANTDWEQLDDFFPPAEDQDKATPQVIPLRLGTDGDGAGADPEKGKSALLAVINEVDKILEPPGKKKSDLALAFVGLGGGTSGAIFPLVEAVRAKGIPILVIATMPFRWEGQKKRKRAKEAKKELLKLCPTVIINNNWAPKKKMFDDVYDEINRSGIMPLLTFLREITLSVGNVMNRDLSDFKKVLASGNYAIIGYAEISGGPEFKDAEDEKIIDEIMKTLFSERYQDQSIIQVACDVMVWCHGPRWSPSMGEILMNSMVPNGNGLEDFENRVGVIQKRGETKNWLGVFGVAKDMPSNEREDDDTLPSPAKAPLAQVPAQAIALAPDSTSILMPITPPVQPREETIVLSQKDGGKCCLIHTINDKGKPNEAWVSSEFHDIFSRIIGSQNGSGNGNGSKTKLTSDQIRWALRHIKDDLGLTDACIPIEAQKILQNIS